MTLSTLRKICKNAFIRKIIFFQSLKNLFDSFDNFLNFSIHAEPNQQQTGLLPDKKIYTPAELSPFLPDMMYSLNLYKAD